MLGESGFGTYLAYGGVILLLLVFVVMFLRLAFMLSLLFLSPAAALLRRLRGVPLEQPADERGNADS